MWVQLEAFDGSLVAAHGRHEESVMDVSDLVVVLVTAAFVTGWDQPDRRTWVDMGDDNPD